MKPCSFFLWSFFGWYVLFIAVPPLAIYHAACRKVNSQGNTAQSPPGGFAQHLLTNFPSYHTETPCNT
ncbi:hypothetical protein, partial [Ruminococcus champanellensis]|uniref:hypothetical protein n=1 Tax=Ruminococcus champanellensis TaxID=1161942 RepID=UPI0023F22FC7